MPLSLTEELHRQRGRWDDVSQELGNVTQRHSQLGIIHRGFQWEASVCPDILSSGTI